MKQSDLDIVVNKVLKSVFKHCAGEHGIEISAASFILTICQHRLVDMCYADKECAADTKEQNGHIAQQPHSKITPEDVELAKSRMA